METVRVGAVAEVPEGEIRAFEVPTGRVAVVQSGGEFLAFGDECTHAGCALSDGELRDEDLWVVCPCHQSAFDVRTGEPMEGPADEPVRVFPVLVTEDGWIEVGTQVRSDA
jgi:nitrite reductase/ring-hydroxylating ferredoxin subunit